MFQINKEEIEKAKCHLEWLLDNGILASEDEPHIENILKYIQHLEQKSETLDKIKDFVTKISTENAEKYNSIKQKEVDFSEWNLALEILNIIEGGNGQCK